MPVFSKPSIYEALKDRVTGGDFAPGQRLKAEDLRADFGLSATSMRELLFRLSTVGLLDFQEQRGFRMPGQSPEIQHDLTQFRILLEQEGACLSIRLGDVEWEARLAAAHHKLSHIESRARDTLTEADPAIFAIWTEAERDFHQTLIDACGSDMLMQTHSQIYDRFRQQVFTTDREFVFLPENIVQHKGILEAVLAHDETLTRVRIQDHLSRNLARPLPKPVKGKATA